MTTAFKIVRPLPAADQHTRELVVGNVVFAPPSPPSGERAGVRGRSLPPALVQLNRRVVELSLERAGIESALAGVRRRIAQLQADADALQAQLAGIMLGEVGCLSPEQRVSVDRVLVAVARELQVPIAAVLGRRGPEPVCWARFIALTLANECAAAGVTALGRYLKMHHGTVCWALHKTAVLRETCPAFRAQYERCVSSLALHPMRGEGRGEGSSASAPARNPDPNPAR